MVIGLCIADVSASAQQTTTPYHLNPSLQIPDSLVDGLHGLYSVVHMSQDGNRESVAISFNHGTIESITVNNTVLPEAKWPEYQDLILNFIDQLDINSEKNYKYSEIYDWELRLRDDLRKLEKEVQELELGVKLHEFYRIEVLPRIKNLEEGLQNSGLVDEMDRMLNDLSKEMDQFLKERKEYLRNAEKINNF